MTATTAAHTAVTAISIIVITRPFSRLVRCARIRSMEWLGWSKVECSLAFHGPGAVKVE
jgi:hypothetical protein